jgi:Protein of unknown function (DUF3752)
MTGIGPQMPPKKEKKDVGPQLPIRGSFVEQQQVALDQEFGPAINVAMKDLSPADLSFYKQRELEQINEKALAKKETEIVSRREDWMLKPPEAKRAGLTKKTVFSKKGVNDVDSAIWTASPADREEVLKKRRLDQGSQPVQISKKDQMAKEIVEEHNAKHRATSLLDQHQKKGGVGADKDNLDHKRFDRERDIVTRQVDKRKRDNMVQEAKTLSSKFSSGKFL